jgi:hypothetical protein
MDDMEEGAEGSRKGTLLTLLRKVILALIGVIVILITLTAVGINIGPLLAGAGILGIAVGFGSQTLVRDILSGVFFLNVTVYLPPEVTETANGDNLGEDTATGGRPNKKLIEAGAAAAIAVSQAEESEKKSGK